MNSKNRYIIHEEFSGELTPEDAVVSSFLSDVALTEETKFRITELTERSWDSLDTVKGVKSDGSGES